MLPIAVKMDTVTALHEDYGLWGGKHVLAAYWTVAVCRSFDATMRVFHFDREAYAACLEIYKSGLDVLTMGVNATHLAVEEVFPKALTYSAYSAIMAMVDISSRVVIP